jgi:mitogen-activated protein kinase 15
MMRASSRWSRAHASHQAGRSTRRAPAAHRFLSPRSLALPARLLALPVPVPACTGAYGIVWKAVDKKTKEVVALKKIFDAFQNATDAQRTYREVIFLQQMGEHENIVQLQNVMKADNSKDLYLVFEYMETDLHAVIRANILQEVHKQYIMYQSFKALKYMHSAKLLLNAECLMKVADFGLARSLLNDVPDVAEKDVLTDYVATRWYRAPEILLGSNTYGMSVDIWSLGCIFGEMLGGKPLFPGQNTLHQLELVGRVIGAPDTVQIEKLDSMYTLEMLDGMQFPMAERDEAGKRKKKKFTRLKPPESGQGGGDDLTAAWKEVYPSATDDAISLMVAMMKYDHDLRTTSEQGLVHPYCVQFNDPDTEVASDAYVAIHHNDNKKHRTEIYREALYSLVDKNYADRPKGKKS